MMRHIKKNYGSPNRYHCLMAALCLVSNYFSFPVPIGIDKSRIHLGNVFCILSAFMLGPVGGGLARDRSFFYDIFTGYGAEGCITFINKFLWLFDLRLL